MISDRKFELIRKLAVSAQRKSTGLRLHQYISSNLSFNISNIEMCVFFFKSQFVQSSRRISQHPEHTAVSLDAAYRSLTAVMVEREL
jgi:hypothetical protein